MLDNLLGILYEANRQTHLQNLKNLFGTRHLLTPPAILLTLFSWLPLSELLSSSLLDNIFRFVHLHEEISLRYPRWS